MLVPTTDVLAFLGGLLPAFIWLAFWLLEDRCHPEPKIRLFLTFIVGLIAVAPVLEIERLVVPSLNYFGGGILILLCWAITEELFKLGAAYFFGIKTKAYDEPIDAVVYLVTAALGFSAGENALFLLTPLQNGDLMQTILTGDLRFIGATLLHTLSSLTIGLSIAFGFYKRKSTQCVLLATGVVLAVALHTLFNFFILQKGGAMTLTVFVSIWIGIAMAIFFIERVKRLQPKK